MNSTKSTKIININVEHNEVPFAKMVHDTKCKKNMQKKRKFRNPTISVKFFPPLIFLLTNCQWLIASFQNLSQAPLNLLDVFIHSSMTYPLHIEEVFQHILFVPNKQHNPKESVKMISGKTNIFPANHFIHSVRWDICHVHLGEKSTQISTFLLSLTISTPSPQPFYSTTPSILLSPQGNWLQSVLSEK